ncbi:MAG TPA: 16S rRNA (guanine(527)-N(7))-methyltransferase RsmG [Chthonomonadaceae bacterium]|nr:16S rRNA (guanine(527)-N(7))-methyltransferase RsmG [Chthonomonadaceae bacterium]
MSSAPETTDGERLRAGAAELGLSLDGLAIDRFARFAELLADANRRVNLTRVDPSEFVTLHFLDSLLIAAQWRPASGEAVIDVGTGAGFPGLPIAIAFPQARVTLLDGTRKKLEFLDAAIAELGLTNAQTLHGRAEEIARFQEHRAAYDVAAARAVARLARLAGWMVPLIRPGGFAVAYKSGTAGDEIEEARRTLERSGLTVRERRAPLPGTDIVRTLVTIGKPDRSSPSGARKR